VFWSGGGERSVRREILKKRETERWFKREKREEREGERERESGWG
jgi:hypothetical protein